MDAYIIHQMLFSACNRCYYWLLLVTIGCYWLLLVTTGIIIKVTLFVSTPTASSFLKYASHYSQINLSFIACSSSYGYKTIFRVTRKFLLTVCHVKTTLRQKWSRVFSNSYCSVPICYHNLDILYYEKFICFKILYILYISNIFLIIWHFKAGFGQNPLYTNRLFLGTKKMCCI